MAWNTYKVWTAADFLSFTCVMITLGFTIAGMSHWFVNYYSYNMAYLSQNLLWCLIAMALFHHNMVNLRRETTWITNNTLKFWILPAALLLTWEIIGRERADGKWLRLSYNISWTLVLALSTILTILQAENLGI